MPPYSILDFLASQQAWFPLYLALASVVILRLFSRRRQLPMPTAITNSLHAGVLVAAWLCPVVYRPFMGWVAVLLVAATLFLLVREKNKPLRA